MKKIIIIILASLILIYTGLALYLNLNKEPNLEDIAVTLNDSDFQKEIKYSRDFYLPFLKTNYSYKEEVIKTNIYIEDNLYLNIDPPTNKILTIKKEEEIIYEDIAINDLLEVITENGNYTFEIVENLSNHFYDSGYRKYIISTYIKFPVKSTISTNEPKQGGYIKLEISNTDETDNISVTTDLLENTEHFTYNNKIISYIPIHVNTSLGDHNIKVYNKEELINEYIVKVSKEDFEVQYLTVNQDTVNKTQTDAAYAEYNEIRNNFRNNNLQERLFEDIFLMPVEGRISTEFGTKRYTNGSTYASIHSGIDIAADEGTNIIAPATGKVIVAKSLTLTGNTIMIDHGMGMLTYYLHMNSLNVEENQVVKQGKVLGTVGSTGFSTGPHLHFTVAINETYINPWLFINNE